MGVQVPALKTGKKHRIVIQLTGKLSPANAKKLKKALDNALDKYRDKCGYMTPLPPKRRS